MGQPPWCGLCRCVPPCPPMAADISFTKRAAAELSRCFNGLTVRAKTTPPPAKERPPVPERKRPSRVKEYWAAVQRPRTATELWRDPSFLGRFFAYFCPRDRAVLAQVCVAWRDALYQPRFWRNVLAVLHCRDLRSRSAELRKRVYRSLEQRAVDSLCLFGASDDDVYDLVGNCPAAEARRLRHVALRCCSVTDRGLEVLLSALPAVVRLELSGCNEITDAGLWASLTPRLASLSLSDCINVADETVAAVTQLLPALHELDLQAYHVTDAALAFFSPRQSNTLRVLRLRSCWELTNHGLLNVVHALPNLTVLSLSGCSKVSDDGVELVAENLRQLRSLDLSWCPRVTDGALEYIACDLTLLEELTLDRCVHITDIGLGYLSTMANLSSLYLRWCSQIRDYGIKHLCSMRVLRVLSLAGCPLLTSTGLSSIVQLHHLQELELTNCPGASRELYDYLHENLPNCLIIE